ncbi:TIR domain-containing protein [Frankia sp. Hr75.2]|nr:TIR domain-containing protein [Frankia sp. Hr75.2]
MTLKVFISYARKNDRRKHITIFRQDLQNELDQQIGGEPVEVFLDRDLTPGADWKSDIENELNTCDFFIPICTESYFQSAACAEEWGLFRRRLFEAVRYGDKRPSRIIPIWWKRMSYIPPIVKAYQLTIDGNPHTTKRGLFDDLIENRDFGAYPMAVQHLAEQIKKVHKAKASRDWRPRSPQLRMDGRNFAFEPGQFGRDDVLKCHLVYAVAKKEQLNGRPVPDEGAYHESVDEWDPFRRRAASSGHPMTHWDAMTSYPALGLSWALHMLNVEVIGEPLPAFEEWSAATVRSIRRKGTPMIALFDRTDPIGARIWMISTIQPTQARKRVVISPLPEAVAGTESTTGAVGVQSAASAASAVGAVGAVDSVGAAGAARSDPRYIFECVRATTEIVAAVRRSVEHHWPDGSGGDGGPLVTNPYDLGT